MMEMSATIGNLAADLASVQAVLHGAVKGSDNPFFKSKYADLAAVWGACRAPLAAAGLSIVQAPRLEDGIVYVDTILMHHSGEWIKSSVGAISKDSGPQAVGSVISYLRRYALASVVGLTQVDDDGEAAEGRTKKAEKVTQPDGYQNWLDALTATADEGSDALKAAWKKSAEPLRLYLTSHGAETLAKLKATAAAVKVGA